MTVTDIDNFINDIQYEIDNRLKPRRKRVYEKRNVDFGPMVYEFDQQIRNYFSNQGFSVTLNGKGQKRDILIQW